MWKSAAAVFPAIAFTSGALACQPPSDMPSDRQEAQRYWESKFVAIEKHIFSGARSVLVANVSAQVYPKWTEPVMSTSSTAELSNIRLLRGTRLTSHTGVFEIHMCADYKPGIDRAGLHLLAMDGQRILAAIPLIEAQQKSDIAAFFKKIEVPNPME